MPLDIQQRILHRKHRRRLLHRFRLHLPQRRDVIQHIKSAPKRRNHQIALARLNHHVAHRNRRQPTLQLHPVRPAIDREERPELRSRKQQIRIHRIFRKRQHRTVLRQIPGNRSPSLSRVRRLQQIRLEVLILMILKRRIHRIRVMLRCRQPAHISHLRHARKLLVLRPIRAAIAKSPESAHHRCPHKSALLSSATPTAPQYFRKTTSTAFFATASGPHTFPITGSLLRSICRVRSPADRLPRVAAIVAAK